MASDEKNSRTAKMYDIVVDYSGYSTLAGLIYVFMPGQPLIGKIFWIVCIILMLSLGIYWSIFLYMDWQEKPVLTTVTTTALPVSQVDFPALTICTEGYDMSVFDASFFKLLFKFIESKGGPTFEKTPIQSAIINNKQFLENLTLEENQTLTKMNKLQEKYWPDFLKENFPAFLPEDAPDVNGLDWVVVMLNQADPELYTSAYALQSMCKNITNASCFEVLLDPSMNNLTIEAMVKETNNTEVWLKTIDFTSSFKAMFTTLWHAKLPCFDTQGMSAENDGDRGILKSCTWKGESVPCSRIFTTFPTDLGLCCSFNMKAADEIFTDSQFSRIVIQLQKDDYNTSIDNNVLPDFYIDRNEPKTQSGRNMGLKLVLDAHSDVVESFSISRDFEGFTALITEPGSFPFTNLKGFEVKPGHNNLVALSAIKIDADDDLRGLNRETRKCLFPDETDVLKLFKTYKQSNCFLECSLNFAQSQNATQGCTPWYFPFVDGKFKMCDPYQNTEIWDFMQNVPENQCNYCLPDCIRTTYKQAVTTQTFRRCDERNMYLSDLCVMDLENVTKPQIWGRQIIEQYVRRNKTLPASLTNKIQSSKRSIKRSYVFSNFFEDLPKEYDAYDKDIAVLTVFFDSTTVMMFKSQRRQSWLDYFANVGGALGLCIGLSIITVVEIVWLCLRMGGLCHAEKSNPDQVEPFDEKDLAESRGST